MSDELYFLYQEYLEAIRLYVWHRGSKFSFSHGKENAVAAEQARHMVGYYYDEMVKLVRTPEVS